jgi:ubiquinone/menaquinone biosynthesis C-methylase UbiE
MSLLRVQDATFSERYASGRRRPGLLYLGFRVRSALVQQHLRRNSTVLDVGAADGAMLELLSRKMGLALAVSLETNPALAALIPKYGVRGSGLQLPFGDNTFDFVICSATRKHVKDSLALMKEMARVLKPGGRAIVIDPHPLLLRLGRWLGKFDPRYLHHLSSASDIAEEFQQAGLRECYRRTHIFVCCVGEKPATAREPQ